MSQRMFNLRAAKLGFFDRPAVLGAVSQAALRVLSRFGAFVRTRARTSIRPRKAASRPGQPPSSHEGSLRRLILFAYDRARRSVVVGPAAFRRGAAPALLEYGGTAPAPPGRRRPAIYRARPYMAPALAAELPRLPALWRNSVRK
jgi:hypothetical protein